ncbi:MAG: hypothetical protein ACLFU0_01400 [Alphaproteobacteria bacterium]
MTRRFAGLMLLLLFSASACAHVSPGVGFGNVLGYEGLGNDLRHFYDDRAWERNATCPGARMDAILRARILEETDETIVASIRYSWLDESRLDDDGFGSGVGAGGCRGIDERRFTLEKSDGDVRVVAMSGPQRPE